MLAAVNKKNELIQKIKMKVIEILGSETGRMVNLDNVLCRESGQSNVGVKISITCLFLNEDGNLCADIYRSGSTGSVDFICGLVIDSLNEKVLKHVITALDENRWSVADCPVSEKKKKIKFSSAFKILFFQKGA